MTRRLAEILILGIEVTRVENATRRRFLHHRRPEHRIALGNGPSAPVVARRAQERRPGGHEADYDEAVGLLNDRLMSTG